MTRSRKFAAVTIAVGVNRCAAVAALEGARLLATQAPTLPMPKCDIPDECRCRYRKYDDRREDDQGRRAGFGQERAAWYAGSQRRKSRGRRSAD